MPPECMLVRQVVHLNVLYARAVGDVGQCDPHKCCLPMHVHAVEGSIREHTPRNDANDSSRGDLVLSSHARTQRC